MLTWNVERQLAVEGSAGLEFPGIWVRAGSMLSAKFSCERMAWRGRLEFSRADQVSRPQAAVIESKKWLGDKESWRKNLNKHRSNRSVALPSASGCFDWTCLYYLQIGEKHGACQLMECSLALLHGRAHGMAHNTSRLHIWHIGRMNLSIFEIKWWSRKTASCSADRTMLNFIIKTANYKVYPGRKR